MGDGCKQFIGFCGHQKHLSADIFMPSIHFYTSGLSPYQDRSMAQCYRTVQYCSSSKKSMTSLGLQFKILQILSKVYIVIDLPCFKLLIVRGFIPYFFISVYVLMFCFFIVSHNGVQLNITSPLNYLFIFIIICKLGHPALYRTIQSYGTPIKVDICRNTISSLITNIYEMLDQYNPT